MGGGTERVEFGCMAIVFDHRMDIVACGDCELCEMFCDLSASSKDCECECHCECVSGVELSDKNQEWMRNDVPDGSFIYNVLR